MKSSYFCDLGAHAKFCCPTISPFEVLNSGGKERRKKEFFAHADGPMSIHMAGIAQAETLTQKMYTLFLKTDDFVTFW